MAGQTLPWLPGPGYVSLRSGLAATGISGRCFGSLPRGGTAGRKARSGLCVDGPHISYTFQASFRSASGIGLPEPRLPLGFHTGSCTGGNSRPPDPSRSKRRRLRDCGDLSVSEGPALFIEAPKRIGPHPSRNPFKEESRIQNPESRSQKKARRFARFRILNSGFPHPFASLWLFT